MVPWNVENPAISFEELDAWLTARSDDDWWVQAAEDAGWKHATTDGNPFNDRWGLVTALHYGGFANLDEFDAFLAEAKDDWADEVLKATYAVSEERGHGFTAYPVEPLTVMVLVGRNATLEVITQIDYLRPGREAIEAVISQRTGRPIPPRSAMQGVPFDPFASPAYWPAALAGPAAKIMRARDQVAHLAVEVQSFLTRHPIPLSVEPYLEDGVAVQGKLVVLAAGVVDPPIDWSLQGAEIIYNTRSALDQLVYELAGRYWRSTPGRTGQPPGRTAFPVVQEADYKRIKTRAARGQGPLAHVASDAIDVIERFQPYNAGGGWDPLNQLPFVSSMSNEDKHRVVRPVLQTLGDMGAFQLSYSGCSEVNQHVVWDMEATLEDGALISILSGVNATEDFDAQVTGHIPAHVFIKDHGPLIMCLSDAVEYVAYVIAEFQQFFR
jgi:hypothetical protein